MSRELTIAWAKRNCPDPRVVKDVSLRLDEAAGAGHLMLVVGKRLTRSRTPYLVISHRREMFAFELTPQQAKILASQPDAMGALIRTRTAEAADADDDPAITLTNLVIDNADRQVATEPVTGHVEYQSAQPMLDGVVIRMMFDLPGGSTVSHYDHPMGPLPGSGSIRFKLTSLMNAKYKASGELPRTLPVFISLCRPEAMGTAPHVAASNTTAVLIDLF